MKEKKTAKHVKEVFKAFATGKNMKCGKYHESKDGQYLYKDFPVARLSGDILTIDIHGKLRKTQIAGVLGDIVCACIAKHHKLINDYKYNISSLNGLSFHAMGWRGGSVIFPFPLQINIRNLKILTQPDKDILFAKLMNARELYALQGVLDVCKTFRVEVPEKIQIRVIKQAARHVWVVKAFTSLMERLPKGLLLKYLPLANKSFLGFIRKCDYKYTLERIKQNAKEIIKIGIDPSIVAEIDAALLRIMLDESIKKVA